MKAIDLFPTTSPILETLEARIAPAFAAAIAGTSATLTGDSSDEVIVVSSDGAFLTHGRFTAGDAGFESDRDFDSVTPGEQTLPVGAGSLLTIDLSGGNDSFSSVGNVAPLRIFGGAGNDTIMGGNFADFISGGSGDDIIGGRQGTDTVFGGDGDDVFQWDPGDSSDTLDGGAGKDSLVFNASNASEIVSLSAASNGHLVLFRNVANVTMDLADVEGLTLGLTGGTDTLVVNDISSTSLRELNVHLGTPLGTTTPDTVTDTLSFTGSGLADDIRVRSSGGTIEITGLAAKVSIDGFDAMDILNVSGGGGVDNVVATAVARTKMVMNLDGETENTAPAEFHLTAPAGYDVGKSPSAIASGNLFGSGNDLVIANAKSGTISALFNDGDGTFGSALELSTGGKGPKSVVIEDFDGDGIDDIAVTNSGSGNVAVLFNNGDGTFAAPVLFATGKKPGVLHSADMDGDGNADLVMISGGKQLSVLTGDGLGGFSAPESVALGVSGALDFTLTDLNGDGRLDVAVRHGKGLSVLSSNGDGSFAAPLNLRTGSKPSAIAVGDFDGDGSADLAVAHKGSRFISVLLNASSGGVTEFNEQLKIAHPGKNLPGALIAGDLDGDGSDDLVIGNTASGTLSVLLNTGAAAFRPAIGFDLDNTPARKIAAVVLTDLNGDGQLDIAAANAGTGDLSLLFRAV